MCNNNISPLFRIAPGKGSCFVYDFNPPACDTTPPIESYAGAKCTLPGANNDPHMVGAHGTRFDFNGLPEKSYCFITDRDLHMNIKMTGYLDTRNESATAFKDGKAVRTWIRELGLVWFEGGISHSFELSARNNGRVERGAGFLNYSKFDGEKMAQLSVGKSFEKGNLKFHFVAIEKSGPFEVDFYTLKIEGLLVMELRLRVANALLRRQEDAEAHINIGINYLNVRFVWNGIGFFGLKIWPFLYDLCTQAGSRVHGILGQTFRKDREKRALTFKRVSAMIHGDITADGKSGKGFLDGTPKDYITSDVMATDCKFSKFGGRPIFTSVE